MSIERRQQRRRILGWSLDMHPGDLAGYPIDAGIKELQDQLFRLASTDKFDRLAPRGSSQTEIIARLRRVEQALAGVSFRAIANAEKVSPNTVRESIRDVLRRLRTIGIEIE